MAPVLDGKLAEKIDEFISQNNVMIFSKSTCPYCKKVKDLFTSLKVDYFALDLDKLSDGAAYQDALQKKTGQRTVPNTFIGGTHIGGCDKTLEAHKNDRLMGLVQAAQSRVTVRDDTPLTSYDYDFVVIGGGSGGLAAAKEAAALGAKVACLDFVKPSPQGTTWGLGGTCVNVGCIPKKLMHQAALLGHGLGDAAAFGWKTNNEMVHDWEKLVTSIQDHIGSLNWGYRVELKQKEVKYINAYAQFVGPHKIQCTDKKGAVTTITGRHFLLATGGRPRYPKIPNCSELAISSDDLFSLPKAPGRTLVVGASYVALECAGFLASLEYDVTVMVRSILLRGFDQQMAELVGQYMSNHRVRFIRPCVPTKMEKVDDKIRVTSRMQDSESEVVGDYDTVLVAVGRDPCTANMGLDSIGVNLNPKTGYVVSTDGAEQTSCPYVYAVGDILEGKPELTPLAIQAGKLLARRLFAGSTTKCEYDMVPTTVFTPLEYGCVGLSEEDAIVKYGQNDLEVYHTNYRPLEWTVPGREDNACYAKLICVKSLHERVVGLHILGPNAGEITQGFTLGLKMGATKQHFDDIIGIHPTCAEVFTTLGITKSSGQDTAQSGC